jgi:integrase/recombinase XerD
MEKLVKDFVEFLENDKKLSVNTLQSYKRDIEQYIIYLYEKDISMLSDTDRATVLSYLLKLKGIGRSPPTISRCLASIRSFYKYSTKNNIVSADPTEDLESPKVERKPPKILTKKEVELLLEQPNCEEMKGSRDKAMLELLYATGIRVSELIAINLLDVDIKEGYITCNFNGKTRILPVGKLAIEALVTYLEGARANLVKDDSEDALFVNLNGSRITRQGFWKIIKYYKNQARITKDITPHTLRHSVAAHLLQNGADMKSIQQFLGHSDISSTQIYAQLIKNNLNDVYKKTHPRA